jgi:hypothetical protein
VTLVWARATVHGKDASKAIVQARHLSVVLFMNM